MLLNKISALEYLRIATGKKNVEFKDRQWEAIDKLVNKKCRSLVIQKTGWGKSVVYFASTKFLREQGFGPTIVISPLLALMRNQVQAAEKLNLNAATLNSTNQVDHEEIKRQLDDNKVDLIFLSPEKIGNDNFVKRYIQPIAGNVGLLVIDEAHCISDWGHDFRPDYKRIIRILNYLPKSVPVLATTATANKRVVNDILAQLGPCTQISRGPLARPSLSLDVIKIDDPAARLAWLTTKIQSFKGRGIVYVLTQRDAERVADWLIKKGINAKSYHGGLDQEREKLEKELIDNKIKCLVATSALGMGFDKPDLEFVIHYQAPNSVVDYYQQVGRAGRGIDKAYGILIYGEEDAKINKYFRTSAFPNKDLIKNILNYVENSRCGIKDTELMQKLNISKMHLVKTLKFLSTQDPAPIIIKNSKWIRTSHNFTFNTELINHITRIRESEWEEILEYGAKQKCLMQFLTEKLDDPGAESCQNCSVCLEENSSPDDYDDKIYEAAQSFLSHSEKPIDPRKQFPTKDIGIKFGAKNSKIPECRQAESGYTLSRYGEPVIGRLVREGKIAGKFDQKLVCASVEMIQKRWPDTPHIKWVACIPSIKHPKLVSDFTSRLAKALNLPFYDALKKPKDTYPQKSMENKYYQCRNLLGAFEATVPDTCKQKNVLLIDDIVDSRWTLTVAAYLLRDAGAGRVYPFALASSAPDN